MKICPNCKATLQDSDRFCPECGIQLEIPIAAAPAQPVEQPQQPAAEAAPTAPTSPVETAESPVETANLNEAVNPAAVPPQPAYNAAPQAPAAPYTPAAQPIYPPQGYQQQPPYAQPGYPVYGAPGFTQPRKANSGMLTWSIICIVLGVFSGLPSLVMGIVALVKTVNAAKALTPQAEAAMLKTAKTLNIVATVIGVLLLILEFLFIGYLFTAIDGAFDGLYY